MKKLCSLALALAAGLSCHGADSNRSIHADLQQPKGPRSSVWQECVGAGRVAEGLRDTWRRQLEECHRALGFRYLRMHGLLHDELGVYSEAADGSPRYNWQNVDDVYDHLLSIGMKPFVEIGFMPRALASGNQTIFWWNANVTPPSDYAKWDALISALVRHWTARYGEEEVKTWRFEIWNEPNLDLFWHPAEESNRRQAYFTLYDHTVRAVKAVCPDYSVGGPAGAGPIWTKELIQYCAERRLPLDFVSFHAYGLGSGPSGLDPDGNAILYLNPNLRYVADTAVSQRPLIDSTEKAGLPVHITEWSASYSPRDPIHDSYFSAPFILEQLRRTESLQSMSYWTFTDIFEENGPPLRPFHGGFGLINAQGIRKPAYWAYSFLARLGPTELRNKDESSYVCTDENDGVQVLAWDLSPPTDKGRISNQEHFFRTHPSAGGRQLTLRLSHMVPGSYKLAIYQIGYHQNDPYSRYLEMGSPADLSRDDVVRLKTLSTGKPTLETTITIEGEYTESLSLQENSVWFMTLTKVSK